MPVEEIKCTSVEGCIATFGNLMSSAMIYGDTEECQTLMEAFRRRRLVQARGRFYNSEHKPECEDVSNKQPTELLETSSHPVGGGPTPNCPECGGTTQAVGWLSGNWTKVKSKSGQLYWYLPSQPTDPMEVTHAS